MAWEFPILMVGDKTAGAGYSSSGDQYSPVKSTANGNFTQQVTRGGVVYGVLQDTPSSGESGNIMVYGVSRARVNSTSHAAIAVFDKLVASTGGGFIPSTGNVDDYIIGRALETLSSNSTGIIAMLITHQGGGSSGNAAAV